MAHQKKHQAFSYDEVGDVIRSATRLQQLADEKEGDGEVSLAQLREIAAELGISPDSLSRAIATSDRDAKRIRKLARRKLLWFRHAGVYAVSTLAMLAWYFVSDPSLDFGPLFVWGAVVGIHAVSAFSSKGSGLDQRLIEREGRRHGVG